MYVLVWKSRIIYLTNIASVHLVMGCPNSRAGVRIVKKKTFEQPEQPKF